MESSDGYGTNDFAHGAAESEMLSFRSVAKWVTSPTRLLELATRFPQGHRVGDTALETDVCAVTFDAACPQDQPRFCTQISYKMYERHLLDRDTKLD